jgi:hypothetical protein
MDKLGIVFSGRVRSAFLGLLALWILLVLGTGFMQVMGAYFGGGGFDVTVREFINVEVFIFFPYFLVAAVVLRSLAARIALFHKLRRQIVVPEYSPPEVLSPAEAGLLVDNDFTFNEIAGTLKSLELRGVIGIQEKPGEVRIHLLDATRVDDMELNFLHALLGQTGAWSSRDPGSTNVMLDAGHALAYAARDKLVAGGQLPRSRVWHKIIRRTFAGFVWLAVAIQVLLTAAILNPEEVFKIGYPRYDMHVVEPILEAAMVAVVALIIASGFWQRSLNDDSGLKNWRYVAGLRMYIEKVHKDRFFRDGQQMASQGDMDTFYPYALALGIETRFTEKLKRSLVY